MRTYFVIFDLDYHPPDVLQLLYIDSLDVSGLNLDLPEGRYAINIWSKENIDTVVAADMKVDGKSFGNLPVHSQLCFFVLLLCTCAFLVLCFLYLTVSTICSVFVFNEA